MPSFNKAILMGNLTRDPQLKYLPSQTAVAEFGLACNRRFKDKNGEDREEVLFVDCSAFGRTGETINQYFTKGKPIFIEGRLKYDSWEDKNGGGKRSKLSVIVDTFQFVGSRDDGGGGGDDGGGGGGGRRVDRSTDQTRQPQRPTQRPPRQQPEPPFSENQEFKEDDIPFAWGGRMGQPV